MAVIFPEKLSESIRNDPKRGAERRLYDALTTLDDKHTVYYSVAWQSRYSTGSVKDGEADFVIAHPDFGVIVIEVKGGQIEFDSKLGQWYSTSRAGIRYEIKDPVQQALTSHKTLLEKLKELPGWGSEWLTIGHAVAFPDIALTGQHLRLDLPQEIVIDSERLKNLPTTLKDIFSYYSSHDGYKSRMGYKRLELIDNLLAKSFELRTPLGLDLEHEDARLVELTEQQFGILDFISHHRRAAIEGCAGSGKTMLALHKAEQLSQQGFAVLLTCFNHALAVDLSERIQGNFAVLHFHGLCRHFIEQEGYTIRDVGNDQDYYDKYLPDALLDAIDSMGPQFDAIIVDEGQDFKENWWFPLLSLLKDTENGVFYVFFDNNQNLYHRVKNIRRYTENCVN